MIKLTEAVLVVCTTSCPFPLPAWSETFLLLVLHASFPSHIIPNLASSFTILIYSSCFPLTTLPPPSLFIASFFSPLCSQHYFQVMEEMFLSLFHSTWTQEQRNTQKIAPLISFPTWPQNTPEQYLQRKSLKSSSLRETITGLCATSNHGRALRSMSMLILLTESLKNLAHFNITLSSTLKVKYISLIYM